MNLILIEDNPGDIALFQEALIINNLEADLTILEDGEMALNQLHECPSFVSTSGLPDMVIIDINLPKVSGKEVLREMNLMKSMDHVPKIILSTSNLKIDMDFCYENGANCFLTKPNDVFEFFDLVKNVLHFWKVDKPIQKQLEFAKVNAQK